LACRRTYSKPTPIASRFLRPLVSTCLYGRPTIFFRPHPFVSFRDATLIFRRLSLNFFYRASVPLIVTLAAICFFVTLPHLRFVAINAWDLMNVRFLIRAFE
jgi:hypothetical protein